MPQERTILETVYWQYAESENMSTIEAPPAYYGVPPAYYVAPPAYSDAPLSHPLPPTYSEQPGEDLVAQLAQMKAMMEQMRLEKKRMETETKRKAEEDAEREAKCKEREKNLADAEEKLKRLTKFQLEHKHKLEAKEREIVLMEERQKMATPSPHPSADFESWNKTNPNQPNVYQSIVEHLKTISQETVYAIHSIAMDDYGAPNFQGCYVAQTIHKTIYIATNQKLYKIHLWGDLNSHQRTYKGCGDNGKVVIDVAATYKTTPTASFWKAVYSQMQSPKQFTVHGHQTIYHTSMQNFEALFQNGL